jgi:hypothetical protein
MEAFKLLGERFNVAVLLDAPVAFFDILNLGKNRVDEFEFLTFVTVSLGHRPAGCCRSETHQRATIAWVAAQNVGCHLSFLSDAVHTANGLTVDFPARRRALLDLATSLTHRLNLDSEMPIRRRALAGIGPQPAASI